VEASGLSIGVQNFGADSRFNGMIWIRSPKRAREATCRSERESMAAYDAA